MEAKPKRKRGRPKGPKPPREDYTLRLRPEERQRMERLAAAAGVTLAEWLRRRGLTE